MPQRILLVDDDELILISVGELFRANGFQVDAAESGARALELAATTPYDAVILDIIMPRMSGHEVCRRLRELPGGRSVPVIMLTAKSIEEERRKGREAGADEFLPKPFDPGRLLDKVRELLNAKMP